MSIHQKNATPLYGFSGKFAARRGEGQTLANILIQAAKTMAEVNDCLLYVVSLDALNPDLVCVFETWNSKEAHDNALATPDVKALISKAMPLIDGKPEGQVLHTLGGLGLS